MRKQRNRQRGFSLIELLIVIAIILIIVGVAVPKLGSAQMSAREMAAVREIQTINTAQTSYFSQFTRYATTLTELGPPPNGTPSAAAADLIPASLASGQTSSGYLFELKATPTGYTINANPKVFGTTGRRTFYSDQTYVIRQNNSAEPATATSPEINAVASEKK